MENNISKYKADLISFNCTKTIEYLQQKLAKNEKLIFEEEQALNSYETLKNLIENLHASKGRLLNLPPLEKVSSLLIPEQVLTAELIVNK